MGTAELDWRVCSRARLARDARFDGKFFIGVRTTKVYCRPTCPARTCKESNVRYFASAAAAAEAGFRPCLRCRPECSPGTLAGAGTQNTVARALRLIGESGLEDGGVESLADRLGVGSRHLRRLFLRYLGATPSAVAHTRRLHFTKKLIDETRLPMTQVAIASGFGCVRRFNDCIRRVYRRTPTQLRHLAGKHAVGREGQYVFHLHFRPPYNWKRMLEFLSARTTPGVEAVEGGVYSRTISLQGSHGYFEVSLDEEHNRITARIEFGDPRALFVIIERIGAMFDLRADWAVIARTLRADPLLERRVGIEAGTRVAGCWDGFELVTRAIVCHRDETDASQAIMSKTVKGFGRAFLATKGLTHLFPSAEVLMSADMENIGVTRERASAIRAIARAVHEHRIRFDQIADGGALLARLREIPGIAKAIEQHVVMRVLRDPDAFPSADPVLRRMMGKRSARELEDYSAVWRPWRAYAAMQLWQKWDDARSKAPKRKVIAAKNEFVSVGPQIEEIGFQAER